MKYGVLPFRFGRAAAEPASERLRNFYREVAEMCAGGPAEPTQPGSPITVPLTYEMISDAQLMFRISEAYMKKWIEEVDLVLIDLANPSDQILPNHHVIATVAELVLEYARHGHGRARRFLLLLPTMLAPGDPVVQPIARLIQSGALAIVADTGRTMSSPAFGRLPSESEYTPALQRARGSPAEIIRRKLVRFPGHFKRYDASQHSHCTNYFFDGRLCQAELVDYIDGYVAAIEKNAAQTRVFYHSTISQWLSNAIDAYSKRRGGPISNLEGHIPKGNNDTSDVILIVPLVDTGGTLERLIIAIRSEAPHANIHVLTILSTRGPAAGPDFFSISVGGEQVRVDYAAKVSQRRFAPAECPLCRVGAEVSNPIDPDPFTKLSVHAFWTLAIELGFEAEADVPAYRPSLGMIPAFRRIGGDNGPFLAYKVNKVLRSGTSRLPATPIILCPLEDGVGAIAVWLEAVFGMTVIKIPKTALASKDMKQFSSVSAPELFFQEPKGADEVWLTQLRSLKYFKEELGKGRRILGSPDYSVVILDEINVSGRTRRELTELAQSFGLEASCCMSLVDFAPTEREADGNETSLYDVDLQPLRDERRGTH